MGKPAWEGYANLEDEDWRACVLADGTPKDRVDQTERWRGWLQTLLTRPDQLPTVRVLKTSKNVQVFEAQGPLETTPRVVCKQSSVSGVGKRISRFLRRSAARRNFERAIALQGAGIGTARPLAWLEGNPRGASSFVTEFLDSIIDLDTYVLSVLPQLGPGEQRAQRQEIVDSLVRLFRGLEKAGLYHRDMKASNILIRRGDFGHRAPKVYLVDLDGLAAWRPWRSRWKPIMRLASSLLQYPVVRATHYASFLRAYLVAGGEDPQSLRAHFQRLQKKTARYSRAAHRRKRNKMDGYSG